MGLTGGHKGDDGDDEGECAGSTPDQVAGNVVVLDCMAWLPLPFLHLQGTKVLPSAPIISNRQSVLDFNSLPSLESSTDYALLYPCTLAALIELPRKEALSFCTD